MSIFDTIDLTEVVKLHEGRASGFLGRMFFSNEELCDQEATAVDIIDNSGASVAPHVAPLIGGVVVEKEGYTTKWYKPPCRHVKQSFGRLDAIKRRPGEKPLGEMSPSERLAAAVGQASGDLIELLDRSREADCASVLFNEYLDVKGPGVDERITYASPAPATTVETSWGSDGADPVGDLNAVKLSVIQGCGLVPDVIVMNSATASKLIKDASVQKLLDNRRIQMGEIVPRDLEAGTSYLGSLIGMDLYTCDEVTIAGGVSTKLVPDDKVLVASTRGKAKMVYGISDQITNPAREEVINSAEKYVINAKVTDEGYIVEVAQSPLPIVNQPEAFHVLTVTAS